jgi:hypothetical protein
MAPCRDLVRRLLKSACLAALLMAALLGAGLAAEEKPLAALVPGDVGVCLELRGLAAAGREFRSSAHFQRLAEFPPFQRWQEKEGAELRALSAQMATLIGVEPGDVWEKVLGNQSLVAIWPAEQAIDSKTDGVPKTDLEGTDAGRPDRGPPIVVILRASDATVLRKVTDGFRAAQTLFEKANWQTATHGGIEYQLGMRPSRKRPLRLALLDSTAVLSDHESVFHRVLELSQRSGSSGNASGSSLGSLAELPAYAAASNQMPRGAAVTCFVNPRTWEPVMRAEVAAAPERQRAEKQLLLETWQSLESCWATVELTPRVRLQAAIKYDAKTLPAPVADFLACFRGTSQFLSKVPENSLVAVAGRFDVDRFITWARKYGPKEKRQQALQEKEAGKDEVSKEKEVGDADVIVPLLRLLGPDLGIYLKPDQPGDGESWLQWAGAVAVRPQMPRQQEVQQLVRAAVPSLLAGVMKMFSESASSRLASLLTGDGLRMVQDSLRISRSAIPAITLSDGQLWVAGTERALADAQAIKSGASSAKSPRWASQLSDLLREPSHLLYVDCAAWGRVLGQRADDLVKAAVRERGVDEAAARRGLQQLLSLLKLADTLVAAAKIDDGQIAASLSFAVEPPTSPASATSSSSSSRPSEPAAQP